MQAMNPADGTRGCGEVRLLMFSPGLAHMAGPAALNTTAMRFTLIYVYN
jgi:hypothetical protein